MLYKRNEIEDTIIDHNIMHYKKVMKIKAYNNQIYKHLQNNEVRDRILTGQLQPEDYNDKDIYNFLSLLKRGSDIRLE